MSGSAATTRPAWRERSICASKEATHRFLPTKQHDKRTKNSPNWCSRFDDETQAYNSLNLSMWRTRYGDYDDLARIKEWSATQGTIEEIP